MIRIKNHFIKELVGVFLIVVGIFGLIVPIVPGWLFLIPGLVILKINWLKKYFQKVERRKVLDGKIKA